MKLALLHTKQNLHLRCGIFIKHTSPKVWLAEIKRMQLKLADCTAYVCSGLEANSISGVLLILKTAHKNLDIANNVSVQKVYKGFYIPENTNLNMVLSNEEFEKLLGGIPHFFHHEYGLMELTEELHWETLLQTPREQFPAITQPSKGVHIPTNVTAFSVEIEEKEEEESLNNPFGDPDIDTKELPFDMKKVLQGNNREVEKYLKYLEKNPEAALKMAVPLDMMGTSRGKAYAEFKFKSNFFDSIGLGDVSENTKSTIKTVLGILAIITVFWIGYLVIEQTKKDKIEVITGGSTVEQTNSETPVEEDVVVIDNFDTENDAFTQNTRSVNNTSGSSNIVLYILLGMVILVFLVLMLYYAGSQKKKPTTNTKLKSPSWLDLPEDSELFSFDEESQKDDGFYFGGNELSLKSKIIVSLVLIGLLVYLFYPMLTTDGLGILFALLTGGIVIRLLYLLIRKNKTIIDE